GEEDGQAGGAAEVLALGLLPPQVLRQHLPLDLDAGQLLEVREARLLDLGQRELEGDDAQLGARVLLPVERLSARRRREAARTEGRESRATAEPRKESAPRQGSRHGGPPSPC